MPQPTMADFWAMIQTPYFWVAVVIVGILINLVSAAIPKIMSRLSRAAFDRYERSLRESRLIDLWIEALASKDLHTFNLMFAERAELMTLQSSYVLMFCISVIGFSSSGNPIIKAGAVIVAFTSARYYFKCANRYKSIDSALCKSPFHYQNILPLESMQPAGDEPAQIPPVVPGEPTPQSSTTTPPQRTDGTSDSE